MDQKLLAKAEENALLLCAGQGSYEGDALVDTQAMADALTGCGLPVHLEVSGQRCLPRLVLVGQGAESLCRPCVRLMEVQDA